MNDRGALVREARGDDEELQRAMIPDAAYRIMLRARYIPLRWL